MRTTLPRCRAKASYRPTVFLLEDRLPLGETVLGLLTGAALLPASAAPPALQPAGEPGAGPLEQGESLVRVGRISNPSGRTDGLEIRPTEVLVSAWTEEITAWQPLTDLFPPAARPAARRAMFEPAETRLAPLAAAFAPPLGSPSVAAMLPHAAHAADGLLLATLAGMQSPAPAVTPTQEATVKENFGKLPLYFEQNVGQTDASVHFFTRGPGYGLYLTSTEAVMVLDVAGSASDRRSDPASDQPASDRLEAGRADPHTTGMNPVARPEEPPAVVRLQVLGGNPAPAVTGRDEQPGKVNYFLGNDPAQWHTNIATFGRVEYDEVYPGIDLVWYGHGQQLEYDFVVSPGADPSVIRLGIQGAERVEIDETGDLLIHAGEPGRVSAGSTLRQHKPFVYQEVNGTRQEVASRFVLEGQQVRFAVGAYDASQPLVIDPVLSYSTYLGGRSEDRSYGIAVDGAGNAVVVGETRSIDFPTVKPFQPNHGLGSWDAFVAKVRADGSGLAYSTYLGGHGEDFGHGIAVDGAGNAFVTGRTSSPNFPTANAFQPGNRGGSDAFVTKLRADGSNLVYSTYLGGSNGEIAYGITVDLASNAFVTGQTNSTDFPTVNPFQPSNGGFIDVFVAQLSTSGASLIYGTYLGGSSSDWGYGIAVDTAGHTLVTGYTLSTNFPTANPFQPSNRGARDVFVAKLSVGGSALFYSTYLGGSRDDEGWGIAVDGAGNAFVTGYTRSTNFPTANPFQPRYGGGVYDAFVAQLRADGSSLIYATYLGGLSDDFGYDIAVDGAGNAFVTGYTRSTNFPTANPFQPNNRGNGDTFVVQFRADGSTLIYASYLGGSNTDLGYGIAVGGAGDAFITGWTYSNNFPTVNPFQPTCGGCPLLRDSFVTRIGPSSPSTPVPVSPIPVPPPSRHPLP